MLVADLMKRAVATCRSGDSLCRAAELMSEGGCGCLPVIDDDRRVIAVISDRDLCMATCRDGLPPASTAVSQVACDGPVVVRDDDDAAAAELVMRKHRARRLPVVDRNERLVGILSIYDLASLAHVAGSRGDRLNPDSVITTEIAIGARHG